MQRLCSGDSWSALSCLRKRIASNCQWVCSRKASTSGGFVGLLKQVMLSAQFLKFLPYSPIPTGSQLLPSGSTHDSQPPQPLFRLQSHRPSPPGPRESTSSWPYNRPKSSLLCCLHPKETRPGERDTRPLNSTTSISATLFWEWPRALWSHGLTQTWGFGHCVQGPEKGIC